MYTDVFELFERERFKTTLDPNDLLALYIARPTKANKFKPVLVPASMFLTSSAEETTYDNTISGLTATDVQSAIDELVASNGGSFEIASFLVVKSDGDVIGVVQIQEGLINGKNWWSGDLEGDVVVISYNSEDTQWEFYIDESLIAIKTSTDETPTSGTWNVLPSGTTELLFSEYTGTLQEILEQLATESQNNANNSIPLSGTEVGSPVTGDIEFLDEYSGSYPPKKLFCETDNLDYGNTLFEILMSDPNGDIIGIRRTDLSTGTFSNILFRPTNIIISCLNAVNAKSSSLSINEDGLLITAPITSKGLNAPDYYFGANYDDNTYVQKKYVDTAIVPLDYGDIILAGGIENAQVYTTGIGTGIASVDLSPIMAIGTTITVSDLGNNASTHNIQIDAGAGNTIFAGGVASQTVTMISSGESWTIRKLTSTQFMLISKT